MSCSADQTLNGNACNDTLEGGGGGDTLIGWGGDDLLLARDDVADHVDCGTDSDVDSRDFGPLQECNILDVGP